MNYAKLILMTPVALWLSACVGAGKVTTRTTIWNVHQHGTVWMCPVIGQKGVLGPCKSEKAASLRVSDVTSLWGQPNADISENGAKTLIYNRDIAWRGVIVFLGLPIPILIPVGHNKTTLTFQSDHLLQTTYEDGKESSAVCGVIGEGPHGIGCTDNF